ncbi:hypothetical protein [Streptomyces sp. NPDC093149]|uniref:hypothetical protein n=1 Tax=Streptomyces sp. NPDC093149 TaxID=3366031 RepID=UPI0037F7B4C4
MGLMLTLGVVQTGELHEFEIRSLDGELEAPCASVDDVFARPASRENLRAMVRGLLSEVPRENMSTGPGATLAALVTAAGQRWMVEESFQVAKGQVGLDEHEVRKRCSW